MINGRIYASAAAMAAALGGIAFPVTTLFAAGGKVEIEVSGTIKPYCANSVTAVPVNAGDPRKAGSAKFAFTVDCNAPFQYTMESEQRSLAACERARLSVAQQDRGRI